MKVDLFTKKDKPTSEDVIEYLNKNFEECTIYNNKRTDEFPKEAESKSRDILISYISPWVIPSNVLKRTRLWNINFHPGPPAYPGIGCTNFAIYNAEKVYGVTAHIMEEKVDTGKIIAVKRFPILPSDSVYSLTTRSYEHLLSLFFEVMDFISANEAIPESNEAWKRAPYTRRELEELCRMSSDMTRGEIERRVKATTYPEMPGAYVDICGYRFEYNPNR